MVTLGGIEQNCTCLSGLASCSCEMSFTYDVTSRALVFFHLLGLLWAMSIMLCVSDCTTSMLISTWYFNEEYYEDGKTKRMPPLVVSVVWWAILYVT